MNIQNNIKSPCMQCTARVLMCHDSCENYTSYKQTCASISEERNNFNSLRGIAVDSSIRQRKHKSH